MDNSFYIEMSNPRNRSKFSIERNSELVSDIGARYFVMDIRLDHEKDFSNYFRVTACPEVSRQTYEVLLAMASSASEQAISAKSQAESLSEQAISAKSEAESSRDIANAAKDISQKAFEKSTSAKIRSNLSFLFAFISAVAAFFANLDKIALNVGNLLSFLGF